MCIFQCYSFNLSFCFFPHCVHKSVFCVREGLEVSSLKNVLLEQEVKKVANTWDTSFPFFFFSFLQKSGHTLYTVLNLRISTWHSFQLSNLQRYFNYFVLFYHYCTLIYQFLNINLEVMQGFGQSLYLDIGVYNFQVLYGSELYYLFLQAIKVVFSHHLTWGSCEASLEKKATKLGFLPFVR